MRDLQEVKGRGDAADGAGRDGDLQTVDDGCGHSQEPLPDGTIQTLRRL